MAKDIPARRIADVPVELDGAAGTSIREAERKLVQRLVKRYQSALAAPPRTPIDGGVDARLVRQVAARGAARVRRERQPARTSSP